MKPIHKGELEYKYLRPNDKITMKKITEFMLEYLKRYGSDSEFDAQEIVRRYLNDEPIFNLPIVLTMSKGSSLEIPSCKPRKPI